jgi:hypothetical protein
VLRLARVGRILLENDVPDLVRQRTPTPPVSAEIVRNDHDRIAGQQAEPDAFVARARRDADRPFTEALSLLFCGEAPQRCEQIVGNGVGVSDEGGLLRIRPRRGCMGQDTLPKLEHGDGFVGAERSATVVDASQSGGALGGPRVDQQRIERVGELGRRLAHMLTGRPP